MPFVIRAPLPSDTDPYFKTCLHDIIIDLIYSIGIESNYRHPSKLEILSETSLPAIWLLKPPYTKDNLIYHLNQVTSLCQLEIPSLIINNILAIAYKENHPDFSQ